MIPEKIDVVEITKSHLRKVKKANIDKLADYKAMGYTKLRLYKIFSKIFVDKNY